MNIQLLTGWRAMESVYAIQCRLLGGERAKYARMQLRKCLGPSNGLTFTDLGCSMVTGNYPLRFISTHDDYVDLIGEPVWLVSIGGLTINVVGKGLCSSDACHAATEAVRRMNPYFSDDWEALEDSAVIISKGVLV